MKSLKDISLNITEQEYREIEAYSQSILSKFNKEGFSKIDTLFTTSLKGPSISFGKALDSYITKSNEDFQDEFYICNCPQVSEKIRDMITDIFDEEMMIHEYHKDLCKENIDEIDDEMVLKICDKYEYQNNWKNEKRIETVKEKGDAYYHYLYEADGREIIDVDTFSEVVNCAEVLKNSDVTKDYFNTKHKYKEILYQLKFKSNLNNIPIKAMIDLIIVDHKKKTITLCDIKTTHRNEIDFPYSFLEYNYYIQANMYCHILFDICSQDKYFSKFKFNNFKFIVINKENKKPVIWEYKNSFIIGDLILGDLRKTKLKDWRQLLTELDYYIKAKPLYPIYIDKTNNIIEQFLNKR